MPGAPKQTPTTRIILQKGTRVRISATGRANNIHPKMPSRTGTVAGFIKKTGHPVVHWDGHTSLEVGGYHPTYLEIVDGE